jgi:hypothetical protein
MFFGSTEKPRTLAGLQPHPQLLLQDIMQGYAAVFSMLVRLKRVEQLLCALHSPLMMQPKSTPGKLGSGMSPDTYRGAVRPCGAAINGQGWGRGVSAWLGSRCAFPQVQRCSCRNQSPACVPDFFSSSSF